MSTLHILRMDLHFPIMQQNFSGWRSHRRRLFGPVRADLHSFMGKRNGSRASAEELTAPRGSSIGKHGIHEWRQLASLMPIWPPNSHANVRLNPNSHPTARRRRHRRFNFRLHSIQVAAAPRQVLPKLPRGWSPAAAVSRAGEPAAPTDGGEGRKHEELPRKTDRIAARVAQANDAGAVQSRIALVNDTPPACSNDSTKLTQHTSTHREGSVSFLLIVAF